MNDMWISSPGMAHEAVTTAKPVRSNPGLAAPVNGSLGNGYYRRNGYVYPEPSGGYSPQGWRSPSGNFDVGPYGSGSGWLSSWQSSRRDAVGKYMMTYGDKADALRKKWDELALNTVSSWLEADDWESLLRYGDRMLTSRYGEDFPGYAGGTASFRFDGSFAAAKGGKTRKAKGERFSKLRNKASRAASKGGKTDRPQSNYGQTGWGAERTTESGMIDIGGKKFSDGKLALFERRAAKEGVSLADYLNSRSYGDQVGGDDVDSGALMTAADRSDPVSRTNLNRNNLARILNRIGFGR